MKQKANVAEPCACEQSAELIGILNAISIIAKRLAGRLTALEKQDTAKIVKGEKSHEKNEGT